jgi:hypothetical protein
MHAKKEKNTVLEITSWFRGFQRRSVPAVTAI